MQRSARSCRSCTPSPPLRFAITSFQIHLIDTLYRVLLLNPSQYLQSDFGAFPGHSTAHDLHPCVSVSVVVTVDNYIGYLDRFHVFQHLHAISGVWTTSRDETIETNLKHHKVKCNILKVGLGEKIQVCTPSA